MKEVIVKNTKTGKTFSITKKPPEKPVNIRRTADSPEDQVRNGKT